MREENGGSKQYGSGSPSKSSNPSGGTGFLCRERGEGENGAKTWETRGKCEHRGDWVVTSSALFHCLPLTWLHAGTCPSYRGLHDDDISVCWSKETWEIWSTQRNRCASLELPLVAIMCICLSRMSLPSKALLKTSY